ncbi:MAG: hypothetical protein FWE66_03595, partial [Oscillospiraceae bacterium]|nr:hypothetical protein [Oscillospiraceae bacterium]
MVFSPCYNPAKRNSSKENNPEKCNEHSKVNDPEKMPPFEENQTGHPGNSRAAKESSRVIISR